MSEEKKPERYNTVFLVSQLQDEGKRKKMIGMGVAGFIVLVILYMFIFYTPAEPSIPHTEAAPAQEAAPAAVPTAPVAPPPATH